jgi:hypothetical protein
MKNSRRFFSGNWLNDALLLVLIFLILKAGLLIVAIAADQVGYFCDICHDTNVLWSGNALRSPLSTLQTWDAQNYLHLADAWYVGGEKSIAFFPLLPALLRAVWLVTGQSFLVAQSVATLLSFGAVVSFYSMVRVLSDRRVALWSTVLLMTFPTAFFLHLIYTEALFILLFSLLVIGLMQRWPWWSLVLVSAGLVLSRPHGIVAVVGVVVAVAWLNYVGSPKKWDARALAEFCKPFSAPLIGVLVGVLLYFGNMQWSTNDPWAGFAIQKKFGSGFDWYYVWHPLQWIHDAFLVDGTFMSINHSILSRLIFFFTCIGLVLLWRSKSFRAFFPLTVVLIAMSALPGTLASYARYALSMVMIFPAIADALLKPTKRTGQRRLNFSLLLTLVILSTAAQLLLFFYHASNLWVG